MKKKKKKMMMMMMMGVESETKKKTKMTNLNLMMKRRRRRNVRISKDPQSVAARRRRERISDRILRLQRYVPWARKLDTASMLEEAIQYIKFLKAERLLLLRRSSHASISSPLSSSPSSLQVAATCASVVPLESMFLQQTSISTAAAAAAAAADDDEYVSINIAHTLLRHNCGSSATVASQYASTPTCPIITNSQLHGVAASTDNQLLPTRLNAMLRAPRGSQKESVPVHSHHQTSYYTTCR
jgi:hypothetical protein